MERAKWVGETNETTVNDNIAKLAAPQRASRVCWMQTILTRLPIEARGAFSCWESSIGNIKRSQSHHHRPMLLILVHVYSFQFENILLSLPKITNPQFTVGDAAAASFATATTTAAVNNLTGPVPNMMRVFRRKDLLGIRSPLHPQSDS